MGVLDPARSGAGYLMFARDATRGAAVARALVHANGVVDRFDLRRHFRFDMGVSAQWFDEEANQWVLTTDDGATIRATYVINAVGLLAAINMPDIPGRDDFQGRLVHTAAWPEDLDVTGKRVGKDASAGKATFVSLLGLAGARAEAARLVADADAALAPYGEAAANLRQLARFVIERDT